MADWYYAICEAFYVYVDGGILVWGIELGYEWWDFIILNPLVSC